MHMVYVFNPAMAAPQYYCRVPRFMAAMVIRYLQIGGKPADYSRSLKGE